MAEAIRCKVVAPTGLLFEGEATSLRGPGYEGGFGLLPRHAPYLVQLAAGRLALRGAGGAEAFAMDVTGGFLLVAGNQCMILVEEAAAAAASAR